jgi:mRNA-degrading endonuclease RelE of RelBE toxin-antitoxin system
VFFSKFDKNQPSKFIKKSDSGLKAEIKKRILEVEANPFDYEFLHGKLKRFRSCHFHYHSIEYRIVFSVKDQEINIIYVGSRENAYNEIQKNLI